MSVDFRKIFKILLLPFLWIGGILLYLAVVFSKFLFLLYETLIPRGLREIVPLLNLWRKYLVYISNLFSRPEKIEMIKVEEEFEEILQREDRINKAYPLQRVIGETYDHVLIIVLIIAVSILLIQTQTTSFDVFLDTLIGDNEFFNQLNERNRWLLITLIAMISSTMMGFFSFIATVFGPIYALFHRSSLRMVEKGAYRYASFYQKFEDLFALPYLASKSSFSFFDAPPISAETYDEFSFDLKGGLKDLRKRFTSLLNIDPTSLSEKTKSVYQRLLSSKIEERLDMTQVEDSISRAFALEIWQKETSLIPWKKEPGLAAFAAKHNMSYKEAKEMLDFVTIKLKEKFISEEFYSSILLNGALKGVWIIENRYDMPMSDLEYNQLAFSLALGGQRYIIDHFARPKLTKRIKITLKNLSYGFVIPFWEFIKVFYSYIIHIGSHIKSNFSKGWTKRTAVFFGSRFAEIQKGLFSVLFSSEERKKKKQEEVTKLEAKEVLNMLGKAIFFLFKIILALPLSLYYMIKFFVQLFFGVRKLWKPETKKKRNFEKDIAIEAMVAMYEEIHTRLVLETFYYT